MKYLFAFFLMVSCLHGYSQEYDTTIVEESVDYETTEEATTDYHDDDIVEDEEVHVMVEPESLKSMEDYQSEKIIHKTFDENEWRRIVGENDYLEEKPDPPKFNMPSAPWAGPFLKGLGYTFITALILLLLYFVFKNITFNTKVKKATIAPYTTNAFEDLHELDIDGLLRQALAEKNFRLAIRFYYLGLLRNLNDEGMIKWEKDKTNRDYLSELFSRDYYYDEVKKLTRGYEEVWYGDHPMPDESLQLLINKFQTVTDKLKAPKVS